MDIQDFITTKYNFFLFQLKGEGMTIAEKNTALAAAKGPLAYVEDKKPKKTVQAAPVKESVIKEPVYEVPVPGGYA